MGMRDEPYSDAGEMEIDPPPSPPRHHFGYPVVPRGDVEIRFQLSAGHTEADVDEVLAALAAFRTIQPDRCIRRCPLRSEMSSYASISPAEMSGPDDHVKHHIRREVREHGCL